MKMLKIFYMDQPQLQFPMMSLFLPQRLLKASIKKNILPKVKGILFEGEFLPGEEFKRLADMPSKDEMLAQLLAMFNSPLQKLVSTISAPLSNAIGVLDSLKQQKSES